MTVLMWKMYF